RQRQLAERRKQDEQRKQEQAKKAAEERKRAEQTVVRQQREQEERLAKQREENLKRIQGLAGATGAPGSEGLALRSSGPSDSYAGRIRGRVKPNIVYTDDVPGNPTATVEVRLAPDGTIVSTRVTKSSGVKTWDDAVVRALERTAVLPRDVDGRVHTPMELVFRPRD
ncbi:MAG: cell envelope integrity protein TolA, partial [Comamonadaceae bacterium]